MNAAKNQAPVVSSPALVWEIGKHDRCYAEAHTPFASYFAERSAAEGRRPVCWWLRVELTPRGGADPLIKRFTLNHYRTRKDAKVAAEIYDVGLAHKAEERDRREQ